MNDRSFANYVFVLPSSSERAGFPASPSHIRRSLAFASSGHGLGACAPLHEKIHTTYLPMYAYLPPGGRDLFVCGVHTYMLKYAHISPGRASERSVDLALCQISGGSLRVISPNRNLHVNDTMNSGKVSKKKEPFYSIQFHMQGQKKKDSTPNQQRGLV